MTDQEVFDKVVTHLLSMKEMSAVDGSCAYRGQGGAQCAVGCLIPDEVYTRKMEGHTVDTLLDLFETAPIKWFRDHLRLLTNLQGVHDGYRSWNLPDGGLNTIGRNKLRGIAREAGLHYRHLLGV